MLRKITDNTLRREIKKLVAFISDAYDCDWCVYSQQPGFERFNQAEATLNLRKKAMTLFRFVRIKRNWKLESYQIDLAVDLVYALIPLKSISHL